MNYAAIDLGTNSCRLLIADFIAGRLENVCRLTRSNRLGEGLYASNEIGEPAMQRTVNCLEEFKSIMAMQKVENFLTIATSAVREAKNREQFIQFLKNNCAIIPEVISGEKEAQLSYLGVMKDWREGNSPIVVDLGGGSTEIIWQEGKILSISLPVGAVRATERLMSAGDVAEVISAVSGYKDQLAKYPLVMVGGTATSLVAIKLALEIYDAQKVHGQKLTRSEINDIYNLLCKMPLRLRKRLPGLQPERADIIVKGTLIVLLIMEFMGKEEITVSENDILDGVIWELCNR